MHHAIDNLGVTLVSTYTILAIKIPPTTPKPFSPERKPSPTLTTWIEVYPRTT